MTHLPAIARAAAQKKRKQAKPLTPWRVYWGRFDPHASMPLRLHGKFADGSLVTFYAIYEKRYQAMQAKRESDGAIIKMGCKPEREQIRPLLVMRPKSVAEARRIGTAVNRNRTKEPR